MTLRDSAGLWRQARVTMLKHAHHAMNLANGEVDLVGALDKTRSCLCGSATLMAFKVARKSICSFGEALEWESFFSRCCLLHFVPCLRSI